MSSSVRKASQGQAQRNEQATAQELLGGLEDVLRDLLKGLDDLEASRQKRMEQSKLHAGPAKQPSAANNPSPSDAKASKQGNPTDGEKPPRSDDASSNEGSTRSLRRGWRGWFGWKA